MKRSRAKRVERDDGPEATPPGAGEHYPSPPCRRLNVFSLDPAADVSVDTAMISRTVLRLPWEKLTPGPVGESVEVVDVDPSSDRVYDPVDLDHPSLLATDGLAPSTGNPQFHQQMVYAVATKTIHNFERVLGRKVAWAERWVDENGRYLVNPEARFTGRLRIYPHALHEENAYYSPDKKALLFGYYRATTGDPREELPGGMVFTCLSHDIIAHETTHAILDGIHRRLLEATNEDSLAFHEAFADIVAIFQHFTLPGLLLDQIRRNRGDLRLNSRMAELASQFARSTGRGGALRNALGDVDARGRQRAADPAALAAASEPHERGAILVAAVFDAFLAIYESRVADLRRIATGGSGVLPAGDIHPDLAERFADEAAKAAQRVLNICIRAIDYLPPVDVTFGDYLRALITADADLFLDDERRYRLAFIQAFRDRGIYPKDVRALAEDTLRWTPLDEKSWSQLRRLLPPADVLRTMAYAYDDPGTLSDPKLLGDEEIEDRKDGDDTISIVQLLRTGGAQKAAEKFLDAAWLGRVRQSETDRGPAECPRFDSYRMERLFARFLHGWIVKQARSLSTDRGKRALIARHLGIDIERLKRSGPKSGRLHVLAVRPTLRVRPDGRSKVELLVMLTQRERQEVLDAGKRTSAANGGDSVKFHFSGGCTLIIDPDAGRVQYAIGKRFNSRTRRQAQAEFVRAQVEARGPAAVPGLALSHERSPEARPSEPLGLVHRRGGPSGGY